MGNCSTCMQFVAGLDSNSLVQHMLGQCFKNFKLTESIRTPYFCFNSHCFEMHLPAKGLLRGAG